MYSIPPFPALREYIRFPRFADHPNDYQVIVNHIQAGGILLKAIRNHDIWTTKKPCVCRASDCQKSQRRAGFFGTMK
jgi:hypothetical protein